MKISCHTACQHEDKILIKSLYEYKVYNTRQFITEFLDKGWTKNAINRLLVKLRKFRTVEHVCDRRQMTDQATYREMVTIGKITCARAILPKNYVESHR